MTARVVSAARVCECCGSRFGRRRFPSGQLERVSQFADRRFCSRPCYRRAAASGGHARAVGEWIVEPYGLSERRATVRDPVLDARATPANRPPRNAAVAVSAAPGARVGVLLTQIPNPRHGETP